jgi:hypothetical protein
MLLCEVGTGFEPVYTALQTAASPLGQPTARPTYNPGVLSSAEDLRERRFSERMTGLEPATLTLAR